MSQSDADRCKAFTPAVAGKTIAVKAKNLQTNKKKKNWSGYPKHLPCDWHRRILLKNAITHPVRSCAKSYYLSIAQFLNSLLLWSGGPEGEIYKCLK
jgi:hypothetical protein